MRQVVPDKIAVMVLAANRHTCCICRERGKHVQFHHIDENPSNNSPDNLAVLCLEDHSRVTGDEGLGRRFSRQEVKIYKLQWENICADDEAPDDEDDDPDEPIDTIHQSRRIRGHENYPFSFDMEAGLQLVCSNRC